MREISLLAALVCGAGLVHAQTATPVLKDVVVSGSRAEQNPDDLPMSIDVINAQDIERRQIQDIRDIAADQPNVTVPRAPARFAIGAQTGRDQNSGFNIRGLDGNRVLMLVDGIRQPRGYFFQSESSVGRDYIDVGLIKRVEILKGATPALYGSDGVAGLVNFITKDPSDYLANGKTFGGSASASYSGDRDAFKLGATMAGRFNDAAEWLLSANTSTSSELKNKGTNDAANIDRTTPNPESGRSSSLLAKVVLTPGSGFKHVLTFEHADRKADYNLLSNISKPPVAATGTIAANANTEMRRDRLSWDGRWQIGAAVADELRAVVSYQDTRTDEFQFQDRLTSADRTRNTFYTERAWQVNLQANKAINMGADSAQKITYGMDYVTTDIRNLQTGITPPAGETYPVKRFPDTTESSTAIYAQDEIILGSWSITPGVRFDHYNIKASQDGFLQNAVSLSGSAVSPKLGALFRATSDWSVYGNYAAGFKAPNASQVNAFFANPGPGFSYRTIPNPNLKAEKSKNFEIGVRGRMSNLALDVAAFQGRYKDFIEDSQTISGAGTVADPSVFQSVNLSNVRINGFEIKGRYDAGRVGVGELSFPFAYGETKGTNRATGKPVDSIQPAKLSLGANYETGVWTARLDINHFAAKDRGDMSTPNVNNLAATPQFSTPAATTLDLTGQWKITKALRLNAGIYNLGNKKYWQWGSVIGQTGAATAAGPSTIDAYTQPGRYVKVSMVMDF